MTRAGVVSEYQHASAGPVAHSALSLPVSAELNQDELTHAPVGPEPRVPMGQAAGGGGGQEGEGDSRDQAPCSQDSTQSLVHKLLLKITETHVLRIWL